MQIIRAINLPQTQQKGFQRPKRTHYDLSSFSLDLFAGTPFLIISKDDFPLVARPGIMKNWKCVCPGDMGAQFSDSKTMSTGLPNTTLLP
jgi:hypothetical protein